MTNQINLLVLFIGLEVLGPVTHEQEEEEEEKELCILAVGLIGLNE